MACALPGCRATILRPSEADVSRREVQRLTAEVQRLESELIHARAGLAASDRTVPSLNASEAIASPVRLELARFSGPLWSDDGSGATSVRLYLRPFDAHGRFTHPLGPLEIEITGWAHGGEPSLVAAQRVALADLIAMYRSGPMGTHYTVEVPLSTPLNVGSAWTIRLRLNDEVTGQVANLERHFAAAPSSFRLRADEP